MKKLSTLAIAISTSILVLSGCSSMSPDNLSNRYDDVKFSLKDPMAKITSVIFTQSYNVKQPDNENNKSVLIRNKCELKQDGTNEESFSEFGRYNPTKALVCWDLIMDYRVTAEYDSLGKRAATAKKSFNAKISHYEVMFGIND